MSTLDRLTTDLTTALKARDTLRTGTLRQLIGAVRHEAKAGTVERVLTDDEVLQVLAREAKKRRESAQIYTDAGAPERAAAESAEAAIVDEYLPTRLTDEELAALVDDVIAQTGASSVKDMGAVMKEATARAQGRADGRALSALVRARLAG